MKAKRAIVGGLNSACTIVDEVVYRPAVVKLTLGLPRWWRCDLARLSMRLDDRWRTGYWDEPSPAVPGELCAACRRAAIFTLGASDEDLDEEPPEENHLLARRSVHVCGWCDLSPFTPIMDEGSLELALSKAGEQSIRWAWR